MPLSRGGLSEVQYAYGNQGRKTGGGSPHDFSPADHGRLALACYFGGHLKHHLHDRVQPQGELHLKEDAGATDVLDRALAPVECALRTVR